MNSLVLCGAGGQQDRANIALLHEVIQMLQAAAHRDGVNAQIFFGVIRIEEADDSQRIALGNEVQGCFAVVVRAVNQNIGAMVRRRVGIEQAKRKSEQENQEGEHQKIEDEHDTRNP